MQKVSPPSGVYVLTVIALILGIGFGQGGTQWILSTTRGQVIPVPPFVGGVFLVVGIIDIVAGVGFSLPNDGHGYWECLDLYSPSS